MKYGSLHECFTSVSTDNTESIVPAISTFVKELKAGSHHRYNSLLPSFSGGSACKRQHLFLRWMVRCDNVDPGGGDDISPSKILISLDINMYRICFALELMKRKQANMKTVIEITEAF